MEDKKNVNAKGYVELVDAIGEAQSIIRKHETKYTLNDAQLWIERFSK